MDQAGGAAAKAELTEAEAEDRLCVICLVNERDTTVLPCRHMCMCHGAPLATGCAIACRWPWVQSAGGAADMHTIT